MGVNSRCVKLLVTPQQEFTGSKLTRETHNVVVVLMSLFLTPNIIQTIFESLLLTINRKKFIWIGSFYYETISIYIVFSNNKALLSSTSTSCIIV